MIQWFKQPTSFSLTGDGVRIVVVGVGDEVNQQEMRSISQSVLNVKTSAELPIVMPDISQLAAAASRKFSSMFVMNLNAATYVEIYYRL